MKTIKNQMRLLSLAAVLIVATSACNKTPIEEVSFPKRVELLVGQYCLPQVVLDDYEYSFGNTLVGGTITVNGVSHTSPSYYNRKLFNYTFSDWTSDNQQIVEVKGDTLFALAMGECNVAANYHDNLGDHTATCLIVVNDLDIPNPEDTLFIHSGDTIELCNFDAPGFYIINYELEYSNGYIFSSRLDYVYSPNNTAVYFEPSPIKLSPLYTYYKYYEDKIGPEFDLVSFRIFCDPLGIDVTIPVVTLPSTEGKEQ